MLGALPTARAPSTWKFPMTGEVRELGDAIPYELIALEHAAAHFN
jgi:hypothetical protein